MSRALTSRDTATPISRPVFMLFRNFNPMAPAEALKDGDGACLLKPQTERRV